MTAHTHTQLSLSEPLACPPKFEEQRRLPSVVKNVFRPLTSAFRPPTSEHRSFPRNLLFAEALYLVRYIERYGTGTGDMIRLCRKAGLPEPDFRLTDGFVTIIQRPQKTKSAPITPQVTPHVTPQVGQKPRQSGPESDASPTQSTDPVTAPVGTKSGPSRDQVKILQNCLEDSPLTVLMAVLDRTNRTKFRDQVLNPLLAIDLIEMTIPEKPTSRLQKYRLTEKGRALLSKSKPS